MLEIFKKLPFSLCIEYQKKLVTVTIMFINQDLSVHFSFLRSALLEYYLYMYKNGII